MNNLRYLGQTYGRLTVLEQCGKNNRGLVLYRCACACGGEKTVPISYLTTGDTKSCGCLDRENKDRIRTRNLKEKLPFGEASCRVLYRQYLTSAKRKNFTFAITLETFRLLTSSPCFYCGAIPNQTKLKNSTYNGEYIYNGLDRIDSTQGYTNDNVVPCCKLCNFGKGRLTQKEFYEWIAKVYEHNKR